MTQTLAPVALFVYNRPEHAERTLDALLNNLGSAKTDVVVFSDGHREIEGDREAVEQVRDVLSKDKYKLGFSSYSIERAGRNKGLAQSIIAGVSEVVEQFGRVIVLEDDLVTASGFLNYMNAGLDKYDDTPDVFSISGYSFGRARVSPKEDLHANAYFSYRNSSWGWATWLDRWKQADWVLPDIETTLADRTVRKAFNRGGSDMSRMLMDWKQGKNNSWAIRWSYAHFVHDALSLVPVDSLVSNEGHDDSGENCGRNSFYHTLLSNQTEQFKFPERVQVEPQIAKAFAAQYSLTTRVKKRAMKMLGV